MVNAEGVLLHRQQLGQRYGRGRLCALCGAGITATELANHWAATMYSRQQETRSS